MKIAANQVSSFINRPPSHLRAVLLYGPNQGLSRDHSKRLINAHLGTADATSAITELSASVVKQDPARLVDEVQSLSLLGDRRVIIIRDAEDFLTPACEQALTVAGNFWLLLASELGPKSSLRKLFEQHENAAALASYADDSRSLRAVVQEHLQQAKKSIAPDALADLLAALPSDRGLVLQEINKLLLYSAAATVIDGTMVAACLTGRDDASLDDLCYATFDGDARSLIMTMQDAPKQLGAITIIRALLRHTQRLRYVKALATTMPLAEALNKLQPPPFFKVAARFQTQAQRWSLERLHDTNAQLWQAEKDCKSSGANAPLICERAVLKIAAQAHSFMTRAA